MSVSQSSRFLRIVGPQACRRMLASDTSSSAGSGTSAKTPTPPPQPKPATSSTSSGADKYQCEAYYQHNEWSFYDIENAMKASRVGQPSSLKKPSA